MIYNFNISGNVASQQRNSQWVFLGWAKYVVYTGMLNT